MQERFEPEACPPTAFRRAHPPLAENWPSASGGERWYTGNGIEGSALTACPPTAFRRAHSPPAKKMAGRPARNPSWLEQESIMFMFCGVTGLVGVMWAVPRTPLHDCLSTIRVEIDSLKAVSRGFQFTKKDTLIYHPHGEEKFS